MVVARSAASKRRRTLLTPDRRPLHPQWENMNAEVPLAQLECREPMPSIEIQDSEHHVLRTIPLGGDCLGHGGGPFAMEKGKAARTFRELTTASPQAPVGLTPISPDLPGPGVYFLVSVWPPHVLDPLDPATPEWLRRKRAGRFGNLSGNTRSLPVRIEIGPVSDGQ